MDFLFLGGRGEGERAKRDESGVTIFKKIVDLEEELLPIPREERIMVMSIDRVRSAVVLIAVVNPPRASGTDKPGPFSPREHSAFYAPSLLLNIANARIKRNKPSYINPTLRIRHGIIVTTNNFPTIAAFSDLLHGRKDQG